jgi:hypothetical protein
LAAFSVSRIYLSTVSFHGEFNMSNGNKERFPWPVRWTINAIGEEIFREYIWPHLKALALKGWALIKAIWAAAKSWWIGAKAAACLKTAAFAIACAA